MNKIHIIVIVLLGFFLMPNQTYACGDNSNNHSCKMEMSSKTGKKECCCKKSNSEKDKKDSCNGKCGQSMCSVSSVNIGVISSAHYEIPNKLFNFSVEKQKFYQTVACTSAGYYSIWLIPKIS